jgi:hypothetical protein
MANRIIRRITLFKTPTLDVQLKLGEAYASLMQHYEKVCVPCEDQVFGHRIL